ncbi:lysozyme [Caudoviricetes sp.]|nr:lysozyme [Caudoviricetes sp.]
MSDFNLAIGKTLAKEGGAKYTNISSDKGGETKYGISKLSYPSVDIANLTEEDAKVIYKRDYWDRMCATSINSQRIAELVFDTAVNMGVRTTTKMVQHVLNSEMTPVVEDGVMGSNTINALNFWKESEFIVAFTIAKVAYYASICNKDKSQSKFLLGWINRTLGA